MANLVNGNFEHDWGASSSHQCLQIPADGTPYMTEVGNIFTPPGWVFWARVEQDWNLPEGRDAHLSVDTNRVRSGTKAYMYFKSWGHYDAGLYQQVDVGAGMQIAFSAWAHGWSNGLSSEQGGRPGDGRWSDGAGYNIVAWPEGSQQTTGNPWQDAKSNMYFQVGLDPTGNTNPFANTVIWGMGYHIYNGYCQQLTVEATAISDTVTVFIRSWNKYRFKHVDSYWDDAVLVVQDTPEPVPPPSPECRGLPRIDYSRTYLLMPPDVDSDFVQSIITMTEDERWTVGGSADDAGIGDLSDKKVIAFDPTAWGAGEDGAGLEGFFKQYYPGTVFWPLTWTNLYQLEGRLLAYSLKEGGLVLAAPTTHVPGVITDQFGVERGSIYHNGLDIRSSYTVWNDTLHSSVDGTVVYVGEDAAFGHQIHVDTMLPDGRIAQVRYAHLVPGSAVVAVGQNVSIGEYLGQPGQSGATSADHLHLEVLYNGQRADPELLIDWTQVPQSPPEGILTVKGVHGAPIYNPPTDQTFWLQELQEMGIRWFKMLDNGDPMNITWAARLVQTDITPIIRLYQAQKYPGRLDPNLLARVSEFVAVGATYFESENEPNLDVEWQTDWRDLVTWQNMALVEQVTMDWWADVIEITDRGGVALFPAMAPTDRNGTNDRYSSVMWVQRMVTVLAQRVYGAFVNMLQNRQVAVAVHTSPFTRPFDFNPQRSWGIDDMCLRGYETVRDLFTQTFGVEPLMISTEGGCYSPEHIVYLGWGIGDPPQSPYTEIEWAQRTVDMFQWLQQYSTLAGMCQWILTDEGVADPRWMDNGWYRGRTPRPVVSLLKGQ